MKKFIVLILTLVILLFAVSFIFAGCNQNKAKTNPVLNSTTPPKAATATPGDKGANPSPPAGGEEQGKGGIKGPSGNEGGGDGGD